MIESIFHAQNLLENVRTSVGLGKIHAGDSQEISNLLQLEPIKHILEAIVAVHALSATKLGTMLRNVSKKREVTVPSYVLIATKPVILLQSARKPRMKDPRA